MDAFPPLGGLLLDPPALPDDALDGGSDTRAECEALAVGSGGAGGSGVGSISPPLKARGNLAGENGKRPALAKKTEDAAEQRRQASLDQRRKRNREAMQRARQRSKVRSEGEGRGHLLW